MSSACCVRIDPKRATSSSLASKRSVAARPVRASWPRLAAASGLTVAFASVAVAMAGFVGDAGNSVRGTASGTAEAVAAAVQPSQSFSPPATASGQQSLIAATDGSVSQPSAPPSLEQASSSSLSGVVGPSSSNFSRYLASITTYQTGWFFCHWVSGNGTPPAQSTYDDPTKWESVVSTAGTLATHGGDTYDFGPNAAYGPVGTPSSVCASNAADTYPPTVTINQASTQADPTATSPINFTVVFSEPVTGFDGSDVTITGTAGGTKVKVVTGGPSTYNVAVSGMTTAGTVIANIPASGAQDAALNTNTASTSTKNTVNWATLVITAVNNEGGSQKISFSGTGAVASSTNAISVTVCAVNAFPCASPVATLTRVTPVSAGSWGPTSKSGNLSNATRYAQAAQGTALSPVFQFTIPLS